MNQPKKNRLIPVLMIAAMLSGVVARSQEQQTQVETRLSKKQDLKAEVTLAIFKTTILMSSI